MNLARLLLFTGGIWGVSAMTVLAQTGAPGARFQFRESQTAAYRVEYPRGARLTNLQTNDWIAAHPEDGTTNIVQLGSRVVLQLRPDVDLAAVISGRPLQLSRTVAEQTFILQAPDPWTAALQAEQLAQQPGVQASHPVARRPRQLHSPYAPPPNDPYFSQQWHLENRDANGTGTPVGPDLNVRNAWPTTRGEGVMIAICDDGMDLAHPDLASRVAHTNHFNFGLGTTNGNHPSSSQMHGTAVAGLAAADGGNGVGVSGVAPGAQLASFVIFLANNSVATDEELMDMYQYRSNVVSVENHSWGSGLTIQSSPGTLELVGISNAVTFGRHGLGTVMVRAGGNNREPGGNVNDDLYPADPRVIAVAAVRSDGRATRYSSPGAPLLVAAPSAESLSGGGIDGNFPSLFTTDRVGSQGYNQISFTNDLANYTFGSLGFSGTSGSAPQISGLAALLLSVNPSLSYRDVQQIMILAARQFDAADPDITTNGGGFRVSHNTGFGVPDSGWAVRLAQTWHNRPALTNITVSTNGSVPIPNAGYQVLLTGQSISSGPESFMCLPDLGPHADVPTAVLPLVDVGLVTAPLSVDLTGKAALIQRGTSFFKDKINFAAQAGAAFAVIYNNSINNPTPYLIMGDTDYVPIPAVMINQFDGNLVHNSVANDSSIHAQISLNKAVIPFAVTNTLLCEHVLVRVRTDEPNRIAIRITLVSPQGTRSVLERYCDDTSPLPDWTYSSTHHFFESSFGIWQLEVSNETNTVTGHVLEADLTISGVAIKDTDHDGLDDDWEMAHFGNLNYGPLDDPDGDGYSNMREQIMGTDPLVAEIPFISDLSTFNNGLNRLSFPSSTNYIYQVLSGIDATNQTTVVTNITGKFPETEVFVPYTNAVQQFFRVQRQPAGK